MNRIPFAFPEERQKRHPSGREMGESRGFSNPQFEIPNPKFEIPFSPESS
jgi:hypothetical protein